MPKTKIPQSETPGQLRDMFGTPAYAVRLLLPFLKPFKQIWECAAGEGRIAKVLREARHRTLETDILRGFDFLKDIMSFPFDCIVTNPPFSLKKKFYLKCMDYGVPFALLVPADYSIWVIEAVNKFGCEKIIPTRRIDYITPNGKSGAESHAQFHSLWLTKGLGLGRTETYVELTKKMKEEIE